VTCGLLPSKKSKTIDEVKGRDDVEDHQDVKDNQKCTHQLWKLYDAQGIIVSHNPTTWRRGDKGVVASYHMLAT
jgi:hypothetical protein